MDQKIILLGEDEKDIADMYKDAFTGAGLNVVWAANGEQALAKCREIKPDLILLDINMPVKDGFMVLKEIKDDKDLSETLRDTPIVMLTNYSNVQDIEYCQKMGAVDYIVKTEWTPEYIVKKIKKMLE